MNLKVKFIIAILLSIFIFPKSLNLLQAQTLESNITPELEGKKIALFPDWSNFSLSSFEPIQQGGKIPEKFDDLAGWEVSRSWEAGDKIENILKLGDLQNTLSPQLFSLEDIYRRLSKIQESKNSRMNSQFELGLSSEESFIPPELTLADFPLSGEQTIETLSKENLEIANSTAAEISPVADLLKKNGHSGKLDETLSILARDESLANLSLRSLNLEDYSIDSVPSLANAQIEDYEGWEDIPVSEVPGLEELPLSEYPNPIRTEISFLGRVDFIWGEAETNRNETISGSKIDGFNVPCQKNCAHLELDDIENFGRKLSSNFEGKQWIRGRDHWVNGGTGCFAGGKEPTGIHPFGDTIKSVLWDTDESTDTGTVVTYFNIKTNCGDSPYFIGPLPFPEGTVSSNDWVYLGTGI